MLLKTKDGTFLNVQNEPKTEPILSVQCADSSPKTAFLETSPDWVVPNLSTAKGRNLALVIFSPKQPGRARFLSRGCGIGMTLRRKTQNRGNELKKLLKTKDITFCNVQNELKTNPILSVQFANSYRKAAFVERFLNRAVLPAHPIRTSGAIAFGCGPAYGDGWTGRRDTFDWM